MIPDHLQSFLTDAHLEAVTAMRRYPQPNYVISKVAEECGEVVKSAIHCAEGRETTDRVRAEIRQAMAMLMRLYLEGDQVHGLPPLAEQSGVMPITSQGAFREMDKARIAELEAELQAVLDGTAHEADLAKMEEMRAEMRERATIAGGKITALEAHLAAAEADADRLAEALRAYVEYHAMPSDRGGKNGPKGKAFTRFASLREGALTAHQDRKASAHG